MLREKRRVKIYRSLAHRGTDKRVDAQTKKSKINTCVQCFFVAQDCIVFVRSFFLPLSSFSTGTLLQVMELWAATRAGVFVSLAQHLDIHRSLTMQALSRFRLRRIGPSGVEGYSIQQIRSFCCIPRLVAAPRRRLRFNPVC